MVTALMVFRAPATLDGGEMTVTTVNGACTYLVISHVLFGYKAVFSMYGEIYQLWVMYIAEWYSPKCGLYIIMAKLEIGSHAHTALDTCSQQIPLSQQPVCLPVKMEDYALSPECVSVKMTTSDSAVNTTLSELKVLPHTKLLSIVFYYMYFMQFLQRMQKTWC